jgi:hypothetical protein
VALATLGLTVFVDGKAYAALEARSMIVGAIAFFAYAASCAQAMTKRNVHAAPAALIGMAVWLGCALGGWLMLR